MLNKYLMSDLNHTPVLIDQEALLPSMVSPGRQVGLQGTHSLQNEQEKYDLRAIKRGYLSVDLGQLSLYGSTLTTGSFRRFLCCPLEVLTTFTASILTNQVPGQRFTMLRQVVIAPERGENTHVLRRGSCFCLPD